MDKLSETNNIFGITLLKRLCEEKPKNVLLSPPSISFVLKMIFLGAKKETEAQIAKLLSLNGSEDTRLGFQSLFNEMNKSSNWYLLKCANKLFGENAVNFHKSFMYSCFKFCRSDMEDVCFSQETEAIRKYINAWVSEKTEGNISEALPDGFVNPLSLLVLVNTINFRGSWERSFDPTQTCSSTLKISQYETKPLQFLNSTEEYLTFPLEDLDGQLFIFPYRRTELNMMLVFSTNNDLTKVIKGLTYERFVTWTKPEVMAMMKHHDKIFSLPKIKIKESCNLEHVLCSLGMLDAFDEHKADFSGMSSFKDISFSKVLHTFYLEFNEEGIKASAATVAGEIPAAAKTDEVQKADGYFLFFIWSFKTKSILFCGRVSSP